MLALGEAAAAAGASRPGIALRVVSEVPPGSGFGSSAALAVAVTAAYFRFLGAAPDPEKIGAAALEVERRQHGTPSGIDTAAALSGGVLWAYRAAGAALATEPVRVVSPALAKIRAFHSGPASESTGAVVAAVRGRLAADPGATEAHLAAIGAAAARLRAALETRTEDAAGVLDAIRRGERALEGLGVVPEPVRRALRAIEDAGGAAKISGAGALRGDGAGLVLVYHPDPAWWDGFAAPAPWRPIAAAFGAPGARMESVA